MFTGPCDLTVRALAMSMDCPIYYYLYNHKGEQQHWTFSQKLKKKNTVKLKQKDSTRYKENMSIHVFFAFFTWSALFESEI